MKEDFQNKQLEDLEWYSNSIVKILASMICPNGHLANICIDYFPDSGKACDARFKCKQCGRTFSYSEVIKIAISNFALNSGFINDLSFPFFVQCPNCKETTYSRNDHFCYLCQNDKPLVCSKCGKNIDLEDISFWMKNKKCKTCNLANE